MRSYPLVSIIICNWNGGEVISDCLNSLSKIDYGNWELILVDNGSTDATGKPDFYKKFKVPKFEFVKNSGNVGFALANNQGYERAKGELILLLNNDTVVTKNFLSLLEERLSKDTLIGIIQPKIFIKGRKNILDNAGSFLTRVGFLQHWGFGKPDSVEFAKEKEIFSAKGACMLVRREVIEKLGLFDPSFISYFEESDLCWRVWLLGFRVLFYPKAIIEHMVGFTIRRLDVGNINYHYYKNRISSLIKNLEFINLLYILPTHIFISFGIACIFLLRGKSKNSMMILNAIIWNFFNLPKILKKRKLVQSNRKISDSEIFHRVSKPVDWKGFYLDFRRIEEDIERKQPG